LCRYHTAIVDDVTLNKVPTADGLVLDIREAISNQKKIRSPQRSAEEQAKREVIEAVIECDVTKQFPNDPGKRQTVIDLAHEALDKREAEGLKYPNLKVRNVYEPENKLKPAKDNPKNKDDLDR